MQLQPGAISTLKRPLLEGGGDGGAAHGRMKKKQGPYVLVQTSYVTMKTSQPLTEPVAWPRSNAKIQNVISKRSFRVKKNFPYLMADAQIQRQLALRAPPQTDFPWAVNPNQHSYLIKTWLPPETIFWTFPLRAVGLTVRMQVVRLAQYFFLDK